MIRLKRNHRGFWLMLFVLMSLLWYVRSAQAQEPEIRINPNEEGRQFNGVGAISAGASSRLLYDYPEPERSQILDYLFKPNYGASLQLLKIEIGGDMNSTDGSEASHMRSPGTCNCDRGYEWWLAKEAKKRNPEIELIGLAWGAPAWVGTFWSEQTIDYIIEWLDCARDKGITIDYIGGWNERGWDADWYIALDKKLAQTYPDIRIIGADDVAHPWSIGLEMAKNPALRKAVDIIGDHSLCGWRTQYKACPSPEVVRDLHKPLWNAEYSTMGYNSGSNALARGMNRLYIQGRVTGIMVWSLVSAWYANLPIANTGLMLAEWPWSGYYDPGKSIWVFAHTAQFARPGWQYMDAACGFLPSGASYVSLKDPEGKAFSTIIETVDMQQPQTIHLEVAGELSGRPVHVWATNLQSDDKTQHFKQQADLVATDGRLQLRLQPGYLYSLTTTTGQHKGDAVPDATVAEKMALPFKVDFDDYPAGALARYFADINGGFETAECPDRAGMCYVQQVTDQPIAWGKEGRMNPVTLFGDPRWWGDYTLQADVRLPDSGYAEIIGRIALQANALVAGYHLQLGSNGRWQLYRRTVDGKDTVLAKGSGGGTAGQWCTVALAMKGTAIRVLLDGEQKASITDRYTCRGQAGLAVSKWQHAAFDNIVVKPTSPAPPCIPQSDMQIRATSSYTAFNRGYAFKPVFAIDGRPESAWHSSPKDSLPQELLIDLGREQSTSGLMYTPNLIRFAKGKITAYRIALSTDNRRFKEVAGGQWPADYGTKLVRWRPQKARYLKIKAIKGVDGQVSASAVAVLK